jgi:hypothetical protein
MSGAGAWSEEVKSTGGRDGGILPIGIPTVD